LWKRDPVECIGELIGNPAFRKKMCFAPEKAYKDSDAKNRIFDEMWTGNWWWDLQVSLDFSYFMTSPTILAGCT
jgi:hypothetical protein